VTSSPGSRGARRPRYHKGAAAGHLFTITRQPHRHKGRPVTWASDLRTSVGRAGVDDVIVGLRRRLEIVVHEGATAGHATAWTRVMTRVVVTESSSSPLRRPRGRARQWRWGHHPRGASTAVPDTSSSTCAIERCHGVWRRRESGLEVGDVGRCSWRCVFLVEARRKRSAGLHRVEHDHHGPRHQRPGRGEPMRVVTYHCTPVGPRARALSAPASARRALSVPCRCRRRRLVGPRACGLPVGVCNRPGGRVLGLSRRARLGWGPRLRAPRLGTIRGAGVWGGTIAVMASPWSCARGGVTSAP
jgi:hypothetical protein